jgi:predicted  nucleic acid-binding Zn-ribbon protein
MVKNSGINQPTDMVRLGRLSDSEQPKNSIVFNASDSKIRDIKHSGLYISPIRNTSASNLLAYDSITKEVVDIGGTQLKLDDLQVKNLEVVNATILNKEHVYTPILLIGEGCSENENVGVDIHGIRLIHDKSDGALHVNKNTTFDGTVEATQFVGDGGLLSNVQYDLHVDIGDVVENLHVCGELRADGGLLSNITVGQIEDFDGYSPKFNELKVNKDTQIGRSIYVNKSVHAKGNIHSDENIVASHFYGDGTTLTGVSKSVDLEQSNARISELEKHIPRFDPLEKVKPVLERSIKKTNSKLDEQIQRFDPLEKSSVVHGERISRMEPRVTEIENRLPSIRTCEQKIHALENDMRTLPEIGVLQKRVASIHEQIPIIHETKAVVPIIHSNEKRIGDIENKISKLRDIDAIKTELTKFKYVYSELNKIDPIETRVKTCEDTLQGVSDLPELRTRISTLETTPLKGDGALISNISLSHVLSCSNETNASIKTHGNVTAHGFYIEGTPTITSRLGEIKSLTMSSFAEINAYTKSNNGTTAGNTGGLVFKTKGVDGKISPRMTIDGNGKMAVGTHKSHPSAIATFESNTCGFLPPRMKTSELEGIKNPAIGLMVYDTEKDALCVYKKSGWTVVC